MNSSFNKSSRRAVKSSIARYISIILISFLGSGIFAGLSAVSPNMKRAGDEYYDAQNVMDFRMLSTLGFSEADVEAIRKTEGVSGVMAGHMADAAGTAGGKDYTFRLHSITSADTDNPDYINRLKLTDGRMPQKKGEAVVIKPTYGLKTLALNGKVNLTDSSESVSPSLDSMEYTLVGVAESPYYLSFLQGNTSVGSGMIDYVLYIPDEDFKGEGYTDLYVTVKGAENLQAFEDEYKEFADITKGNLEVLASERQTLRYAEFKNELDEAKNEYQEAEKTADEKLKDGELTLKDKEKELQDGKKKYTDGMKEYQENKSLAYYSLYEAQSKLDAAERELTEGEKKYSEGLDEYITQKEEAESKLADAENRLSEASQKIADGESELAGKKSEFSVAQNSLSDARSKLDAGWSDYNSKKTELENGKIMLSSKKAELDAAQAQFDSAKAAAEAATGMTLEQIEALISRAQSSGDLTFNSSGIINDRLSLLSVASGDMPILSSAPETEVSEEETLMDGVTKDNTEYQIQDEKALSEPEIKRSSETTDTPEKSTVPVTTETETHVTTTVPEKDPLPSIPEAEYAKLSALISMKHELSGKWAEYETAVNTLADSESKLNAAKNTLDSGEAEYSAKSAEIEAAGSKLSAGETELFNARAEYNAGLSQYNLQKAEADTRLKEAEKELEDARLKIADGKEELNSGWETYFTEREDAFTKLGDAQTKLNDAAKEVSDGEKKIADGWTEYNDNKHKADSELHDARKKINDGEKKLSDAGTPKWYVLGRDMNPSFVTFKDDADKMHDLSTVFPVVFFLVAALVCLTTMTRMVDEDRTLIGTFKALGYSNSSIGSRYLKYAASASLIGSIAGILVGFRMIPNIIWKAYGIVFALPQMTPAFYPAIGLFSVLAVVGIVTFSTGTAVKNSLKENPASLMRPKAPKAGKRIFLESIKPVWDRMSFTKKVTARNLGLNKKRLLMTLAGILGSTSLVVTALGAGGAVNAIMDDQFGEIFHYDTTVGFTGGKPSPELERKMSDKGYFKNSAVVSYSSAEATDSDSDEDTFNIYIVSPEKSENFTEFVTLKDPKTKEEINFDDNSAVITEKLSLNLNAGIGDTIYVKYLDEDSRHPVKVTGITENYTFNYVYLGKDAFREAYNEDPDYDQYFAVSEGTHTEEETGKYLEGTSGIAAVTFTNDQMGNIRTSIKSVNTIVWLLIIAAGLLTFVVLYNLININVGERERELATLKVLGFYDKETYNYIFRETVILSVAGILLGLFTGVFLYQAVIKTVEPDMIFLIRTISLRGYARAALLTMFFTWIVNQAMKPRIRNIDMLESLKSVD